MGEERVGYWIVGLCAVVVVVFCAVCYLVNGAPEALDLEELQPAQSTTVQEQPWEAEVRAWDKREKEAKEKEWRRTQRKGELKERNKKREEEKVRAQLGEILKWRIEMEKQAKEDAELDAILDTEGLL